MNRQRRDILSRILERIREMQPSLSEDMAVEIEKQIRHEYSGSEVYIQKNAPAARRQKLKRMFHGDNIDEVAESLGVSRRTIYRDLKRRSD